MKLYSLNGPAASGTADKTAVGVTATAAIRPCVFDIVLGCVDTPADYGWQAVVQRFTAAGTSTALVACPLDNHDVAAISIGGITHSVEPTYTTAQILLKLCGNLRTPVRWATDPERGFKAPATAANGIGTKLSAATTALALVATVHFAE